MKKRNITLFTAIAAAAAFASSAQAAVVLPTDAYVTGGGAYRLMFVTTATTDATSTDIGDYNTIADTAGDTVLASDWNVYGGTGIVGARPNTGALATGDAGYSAAIDVPIYTTDGNRLFANNTALWTGITENGLKNQTGGGLSFNHFAFTGFTSGGGVEPVGGGFSGPLGDLSGNISGTNSTRVGGGGILVASKSRTESHNLIAISGVIGAVPEPTSLSLLALSGLALLRRRRA